MTTRSRLRVRMLPGALRVASPRTRKTATRRAGAGGAGEERRRQALATEERRPTDSAPPKRRVAGRSDPQRGGKRPYPKSPRHGPAEAGHYVRWSGCRLRSFRASAAKEAGHYGHWTLRPLDTTCSRVYCAAEIWDSSPCYSPGESCFRRRPSCTSFDVVRTHSGCGSSSSSVRPVPSSISPSRWFRTWSSSADLRRLRTSQTDPLSRSRRAREPIGRQLRGAG